MIVVILGHFAGFLVPHWAVDWALDPVEHQLLAMVVGGITGLVAIVGLGYGFHLVVIDKRIPGETLPFETVKEHVARRLKMSVEARALRQYVSILAGQAHIAGVDLEAAPTPLVQ